MTPLQRKFVRAKQGSFSCFNIFYGRQTAGHLSFLFLRLSILMMIFFNLQTVGEGCDFCFDVSNEGKLDKLKFN